MDGSEAGSEHDYTLITGGDGSSSDTGVAQEGIEGVIAELQKQLDDPQSLLRQGKLGGRALSLRVLAEDEINNQTEAELPDGEEDPAKEDSAQPWTPIHPQYGVDDFIGPIARAPYDRLAESAERETSSRLSDDGWLSPYQRQPSHAHSQSDNIEDFWPEISGTAIKHGQQPHGDKDEIREQVETELRRKDLGDRNLEDDDDDSPGWMGREFYFAAFRTASLWDICAKIQAYCRRKLALQNFEQYRQHNRGGPDAAQDIDEQVSNDEFDFASDAPHEARQDVEDEGQEEIDVEPRGEHMLDGANDCPHNFERYRQHNRGGPDAAQDIDEQVSNDEFDLASHAPYQARQDVEDEGKEETLVEPRGEHMLDGAKDSFKVAGCSGRKRLVFKQIPIIPDSCDALDESEKGNETKDEDSPCGSPSSPLLAQEGVGDMLFQLQEHLHGPKPLLRLGKLKELVQKHFDVDIPDHSIKKDGVAIFASKDRSEVFEHLRRIRALELAEKHAAEKKAQAEAEQHHHDEFARKVALQSESWRIALEELEDKLHKEALQPRNMKVQQGITRVEPVRGKAEASIMMETRAGDGQGKVKDDADNFTKANDTEFFEVKDDAKKCTRANDTEFFEEFRVEVNDDEEDETPACAVEHAGRSPLEANFEDMSSNEVDESGHQKMASKMSVHAEAMKVSTVRGTAVENRTESSKEGQGVKDGVSEMTITSNPSFRPRPFLSPRQKTVEHDASSFVEDHRILLVSAAQLAIKQRHEKHMEALLSSEQTLKSQRCTSRYMLPSRPPTEPELAQLKLNASLQSEHELRCKLGQGRPRCTAGSSLLPHFSINPSSRPRDVILESEAQLENYMSKRSIPQIPSHWGEMLEPRVTRAHKKSDESLERVRNRFQEVFDHVAEAFVYCLSFRVGYLELSTMKARLLQLGLTSRPDDVDGIDMERIFLLSNGNGSSIMNFSQFCRQFTWHFPLHLALEKALQRQALSRAKTVLEANSGAAERLFQQKIGRPKQAGAVLLSGNRCKNSTDVTDFDFKGWWKDLQERETSREHAAAKLQGAIRRSFALENENQVVENELNEKDATEEEYLVGATAAIAAPAEFERASSVPICISNERAGNTHNAFLRITSAPAALVPAALVEPQNEAKEKVAEKKQDEMRQHAEKVRLRGAEMVMESLFVLLEEQLQKEEIAYEAHLQKEVLACVRELVSEVERVEDVDLAAEAHIILQRTPGFFLSKLIHAVGVREQIMLKARTYGNKWWRQHRQYIQTKKHNSLTKGRHDFLNALREPFLFKHLAEQRSHTSSQNAVGSTKKEFQVVEMILRLNMDFQTAVGQEGSDQRQNFIQDLKQDLADASEMGTSDFNIREISPGSVVVELDASEKAAQEIHRQLLDPNSRLRSGKVTRFTDNITLPRGGVMQQPIVPHSIMDMEQKAGANNVNEEIEGVLNDIIKTVEERHALPSNILKHRKYIDPDFERLSNVFQTYFRSVQECFVFLNSRLDCAGITIEDLKKALHRLRVARPPPFSCFCETVSGYNFSRMWRRAGAQTDKHPLSWMQFDHAFRWHSGGSSDITSYFSMRSDILEYVVEKTIDLEKLQQNCAARHQQHQNNVLRIHMNEISERSLAISNLETILTDLHDTLEGKDENANNKIGQSDVASQVTGMFSLLWQARNKLLTLGYLFTPPSFDLCGTQSISQVAETCSSSAISAGGRGNEIADERVHTWEEWRARVLACEYPELLAAYEQIKVSPDLRYRLDEQQITEVKVLRRASPSMLLLWKQGRQNISLKQHPMREDRDTVHWAMQPDLRSPVIKSRHCRFLSLGILPSKIIHDTSATSTASWFHGLERAEQVEGDNRVKNASSKYYEFRKKSAAMSRQWKRDVENFLEIVRDDLHDSKPGANAGLGRFVIDRLIALTCSVGQNNATSSKCFEGARRVMSKFLRSLRSRRNLHHHMLLRYTNARGVVTMHQSPQCHIPRKYHSSFSAFSLQHMAVTPIRKLTGRSNWCSIFAKQILWICKSAPPCSFSEVPRRRDSAPSKLPESLFMIPSIHRYSAMSRALDSRLSKPKKNTRLHPGTMLLSHASGEKDGDDKMGADIRVAHKPVSVSERGTSIPRRESSNRRKRSISRNNAANKNLKRTHSAPAPESANASDETDSDFWAHYTGNDTQLLAGVKLRQKLLCARQKVLFELSPIFSPFEIVDGKVTRDCEKLGLGSHQDKVATISPRRVKPVQTPGKVRQAGEWAEAQRAIELEMQVLKPLEDTRKKLLNSGWKVVSTTPMTGHAVERKQRPPTAPAQRSPLDLNERSPLDLHAQARGLVKEWKVDSTTPKRGHDVVLKPRPPTAPAQRSPVDVCVRAHSLSTSMLRPASAPTSYPKPPDSPKIQNYQIAPKPPDSPKIRSSHKRVHNPRSHVKGYQRIVSDSAITASSAIPTADGEWGGVGVGAESGDRGARGKGQARGRGGCERRDMSTGKAVQPRMLLETLGDSFAKPTAEIIKARLGADKASEALDHGINDINVSNDSDVLAAQLVLPRSSFRGVAGVPPLTRSSTLKKAKTFYHTHRSLSESLRPLFEKDYVAPGDLKVTSKMQDAEEAELLAQQAREAAMKAMASNAKEEKEAQQAEILAAEMREIRDSARGAVAEASTKVKQYEALLEHRDGGNLSQEEVKKLKNLVSAAMEAEDAAIRAAEQAQEEYAAAVREAIRERREADEAHKKLEEERLRAEELETIAAKERLEAESGIITHDLVTRLYRLKKLTFLRTLRKEAKFLTDYTLERRHGTPRGMNHDIHALQLQLQGLHQALVTTV